MRWTDRFFKARDRLLASPDFHAWAARFPLTRLIAKRRASALFDLTAGFVYAQILSACVKLDVLQILARGPSSARELAPLLSLPPAAAARLLKAAAALGLVTRRGVDHNGETRYGLGMDGAALLGNPGALAMIAHHDALYADLADPVALLRGERHTRLARFWPYASGVDIDVASGSVAAYSDLMSASQPLVAHDILAAYDFSRHRRLLDVGGGDGTFLRQVAARAPDLELMLFDLPPVADLAQRAFATAGLSQRARAVGGDMWRDTLPPSADVASLVRVLHDHDDDAALDLLRRVRRALPQGGTLLIAEPMVTGRDDRRVGDAYFGFYLLAMGSGRARTPSEIAHMLAASGFTRVRQLAMPRPMLCSALTATAKNNCQIQLTTKPVRVS